jgi:hypothetical protein
MTTNSAGLLEGLDLIHELNFLRRPVAINRKNMEALVGELEELITRLRFKALTARFNNRPAKNMILAQVRNKQAQLTWAKNELFKLKKEDA